MYDEGLEHVPVDHIGVRSTYKKVLFWFVIVGIKYAIYTDTSGPINILVGDTTPIDDAVLGQVALLRACWWPTALTRSSQLDSTNPPSVGYHAGQICSKLIINLWGLHGPKATQIASVLYSG